MLYLALAPLPIARLHSAAYTTICLTQTPKPRSSTSGAVSLVAHLHMAGDASAPTLDSQAMEFGRAVATVAAVMDRTTPE